MKAVGSDICCTKLLSVNTTKSALSESGAVDIWVMPVQERACRNKDLAIFIIGFLS